MPTRARRAAALGLLVAGAGLSCNTLDTRLKTCRDLRLELVNAMPSEGAVHIALEGEPLSASTLLPALPGGSTRQVDVCVERGDRRRFRAAYGERVVAQATCVVSHATDVLQSMTARVVWSSQGLRCDGW
ncbi:MAG TPA: hypothetical protein VFO85_07945 [Vicinamibacteria bacterium]|nr:hypothetical protein [Vicinamibacteria bacterium]